MNFKENILDFKIYQKAKKIADEKYKKSSAYKSGFIVQQYKKLGGRYINNNKSNEGLTRWFNEDWTDIGKKEYPVYRPQIRINSKTPLLISEIDKKNLKQQINLKQKYKGTRNLPPFKKKVS